MGVKGPQEVWVVGVVGVNGGRFVGKLGVKGPKNKIRTWPIGDENISPQEVKLICLNLW